MEDKTVPRESEDSSSEDDQEPYHDINSCLPFRLQEFCLIAIINELSSYPMESLAMLPRHLRYQLLSNLPNYDLNRVDSTPVAEGIDTERIWRHTTRRFSCRRLDQGFIHACLFMTEESCVDLSYLRRINIVPHLQSEIVNATKEKPWKEQYFLTMLWNIISDVGSLTDKYITRYGLDYHPDDSVYAEAIDGLTAVPSHDFLVHLPDTVQEGHDNEDCESSDDNNEYVYDSFVVDSYRRLWKKQAAPLAKFKKDDVTSHDTHLLLVPRRLVFIRQSSNQLELLNHIVLKCGCQPQNLHINTSYLFQADCNFRAQCFANQDYRSYLRSLLSKIVVLSLEGVAADHTGMLQFMFETITENSLLKALEINSDSDPESKPLLDLEFLSPYLFTIPTDPSNLAQYQGLSVLKIGFPLDLTCLSQLTALLEQQHTLTHVYLHLLDSCQAQSDNPGQISLHERRLYDALLLLFSHKDFQYLKINFTCRQAQHNSVHVLRQGCHNFFPFTRILQSFMISHCAYNQILHFENIRSLPPKSLPPLIPKTSGYTTPDCGTEHKLLLYEFADIDSILLHLVTLPTIRLQEFAFNFGEGSQSLFNQIAQHPDMNVTKLLINFDFPSMKPGEVEKQLLTLCQDFEKLFQMSALKEIYVCGQWLCFSEVKKAIVIGLQQRVQSHICSLDKVHLRQESDDIKVWDDFPKTHYDYTDPEFNDLWSAIFSLPQLDCVEVELWMDQDITMRFVDRINIVKDCWKQFSANKKLKLLLLRFHDWEDDFSHVWGEDRLEPLNTLTHDIKIFVDSCRVPKMYSYTHFTVCDA